MDKVKSKTMLVYFNMGSDEDLYQYAHALPNFSGWVKRRLRQEFEQKDKNVSLNLLAQVETMIENRLSAFKVVQIAPIEIQDDIRADIEAFF